MGHYLTVINVQLEKALAFREVNAGVADRALADARRMSAEALRDVRSTLASLDASRAVTSLRTALEQLATNLGDSLEVDLAIAGDETGYSEQSLLALYRVAQEGLL